MTYSDVQEKCRRLRNEVTCDYPGFNHTVHVTFKDGSSIFLNGAFIVNMGEGYIAIVAEHHGTRPYHSDEIIFIREYVDVEGRLPKFEEILP